MRARTAPWVAGYAAAGSVALIIGGLLLAYADRYLVPAGLTGWTVTNVSTQVVNLAVPVAGVQRALEPAHVSIWVSRRN